MKTSWRISRKTAALVTGAVAALCAALYYIAYFTPRTMHVSQDLLGVAFSPDGGTIATGHQFSVRYHRDGRNYGQGMGNILLWPSSVSRFGRPDRSPSKIPFLSSVSDARYRGFSIGGCSDLRYSSSSRYLMAGSPVGALGIWDTQESRWISRKPASSRGDVFYWPIGFSPDSKLYCYAKVQRTFSFRSASPIQIPRYRTDIITERSGDGSIAAHTDNCLTDVQFPVKLRMLPDSKTLACLTRAGGVSETYANHGKLIILRLSDGVSIQSWPAGDSLKDVSCSPNGKQLVTTSDSGGLLVFTPGIEAPRGVEAPFGDHLRQIELAPNGGVLAACGEGGDIYLWDTQSWRLRKTLRSYDQWNGQPTFSPDGKTLVTAGMNTIRFWRL